MTAGQSSAETSGAPETHQAAGLFTRQASGLVREIGLPAAVAISMGAVVVVTAFLNFGAGLAGYAKADMTLPLILAGAFWIVAAFSYRYLINAIPRVGGEYVYLSRIISPGVGAMVGVGIALLFCYTLAVGANFVANFAPFTLTAIGAALNSSGISEAAGEIGSHVAIALISVGFLAVVGVCSLLPLRVLARVILTACLFQLLVFLLVGYLLATHSHQDFVNAFGSFSEHSGAYNQVVTDARASGVQLGTSFVAMVAAVPFMVLTFNGVIYSYYVGGELRKPGRTYIAASCISIGVLVCACLAVWLLMRHTVGLHFMQAQINLESTKYEGISSLPPVAGGLAYGLVLSGDPVTKILLGLAMPIAQLGGCLAFMAVVTRVLFALAFDRLLPNQIAKISERTHTPNIAVITALSLGICFAVLSAFVEISTIVANISLLFALIILSGGIATAVLPFRRPDLIARGAGGEIPRWGSLPKASVVGGLAALLAAGVVIDIVANPSVFGGFSVASGTCLVIVLASGPIVYTIARAVRSRRSAVDLSLAMRELPPE